MYKILPSQVDQIFLQFTDFTSRGFCSAACTYLTLMPFNITKRLYLIYLLVFIHFSFKSMFQSKMTLNYLLTCLVCCGDFSDLIPLHYLLS